jgi:hypothetical protein
MPTLRPSNPMRLLRLMVLLQPLEGPFKHTRHRLAGATWSALDSQTDLANALGCSRISWQRLLKK